MIVQTLFMIWFSLSIFLCIAVNMALLSFLSRRGIKTRSLFHGTPGYLDRIYIDWCKAHNKPYLPVIVLRCALLFSAILAVIFFRA